jgi:hypothetical protein
MVMDLEGLDKRINKIEKQKEQEILTLVEILSNAKFFGEIKKSICLNSSNGQCSYFIIRTDEKNTLPIVTNCRIKNCQEKTEHGHIEISNITCSLCHVTSSRKQEKLER